MITSNFKIIKGIKEKTEKKIKEQGINNWDEFLKRTEIKGISKKQLTKYKHEIRIIKKAVENKDHEKLAELIPKKHHWQLYKKFMEEAIYLDLEKDRKGITIISISDGENTKTLLRGKNLCKETIKEAFKRGKILISYNGSSYDLPTIKKEYGIEWKGPHIDLKPLAEKLGMKGGLKSIEKKLGITRKYETITTIRKGEPALLYRMWKGSKDDYYGELLLEYNQADTENLEIITKKIIKKLEEETK